MTSYQQRPPAPNGVGPVTAWAQARDDQLAARCTRSATGGGHTLGTREERRSMRKPAAAAALVAAAPNRLVGTPASRGTGCGASSTAVPGTNGATKNGAQ